MRILIFLFVIVLFTGCSSSSPEDIYGDAVSAYKNRNAAAFEKTLSARSLAVIDSAVSLIPVLSEEAKSELAGRSSYKMKKITRSEYILLQMNIREENPFDDYFCGEIKNISINGGNAELLSGSGIIIRLIKENGEWKIDLTDF